MSKGKKVGVHGTDAETGRDRGEPKKTDCPITLEQFQKGAIGLVVKLTGKNMLDEGGKSIVAGVKAPFSTGSFGWYGSEKIDIVVDGVPHKAQVSLNITLVNSKENGKTE